MSLEGIGEAHFLFIVQKLLENYILLPPGTVRFIDIIVAKNLVFIEIEDTIFELYNAIKQLIAVAKLSHAYNAAFLTITPIPKQLSDIPTILFYYFWMMHKELGSGERELWLLDYKKDYIVFRIKLANDNWIEMLKLKVKEIRIEITGTTRNDFKRIIIQQIIPALTHLKQSKNHIKIKNNLS